MGFMKWILRCSIRPLVKMQAFLMRSIDDKDGLNLINAAWKESMRSYETKHKGD